MKLPFRSAFLSTLALAAAGAATPASAVVIFLSGAPTAVPGGYEFSYQGNFSNDEGIQTGSTLVIFDFAGYIANSVFSPYADVAASVELMSNDVLGSVDFTDDPGLFNLRFTYTGANSQDLSNIDFAGLSAQSILGGISIDGFSAITVKSAGTAVGTNVFSVGQVGVPFGVPEPAAWAMMLGGFGLVGASFRRRRRAGSFVTA
jgi:hypothetical protein